jgi:osmotically-inducible protein OsmY
VVTLKVRLPFINKTPDPEIARDVVEKLENELPSFIKVTVKEGCLTLEGSLESNYQRDRAEKAAQGVRGVIGVTNDIKLKPRVVAGDIKRKIEDALKRSAELDADSITVDTVGSKVRRTGTVRSWPSARKRNRRPDRLPALRRWRAKLPSVLESWTNGVRADRGH